MVGRDPFPRAVSVLQARGEQPRDSAGRAPAHRAGRFRAARRETVRVGRHAIVAEAGASRAFYHVERGAPLVVRTPVADAVVKGTSFSVWLDGRREAEMRSALSAGAAGAVLTVVV